MLSEVLESINKDTPLIVEIKPEGNRAWVNETCSLAYDELKQHQNRYCIESFDPLAVNWFKKNAPGVIRGQLSMSRKKYVGNTKATTAFMLQNLLFSFLSRPHFIAYDYEDNGLSLLISRLLGAMIVRWTVKSQALHDTLQPKSDGIIFEGYSPSNSW